MDYILDENGLISDADGIFEEADQWYEQNEPEKEIACILNVPRRLWSNRLWFRLICAYNNNGSYEESEEELKKIEPCCKKAIDKARLHYYRGWLRGQLSDNPLEMLMEFQKGLAEDPDDALDLKSDCEQCMEEIHKILDNMQSAVIDTVDIVKQRCSLVSEDKKIEADDETFQLYLGFYQGISSLGFDRYFLKYSNEDLEKEMQHLEMYNITDRASFFKCIQENEILNQNARLQNALAYINGNPRFDIEELGEAGQFYFQNYVAFVKLFAAYLPDGGVLAWDIGEKIGLARRAYACNILGNTDFVSGMLALSDQLKEVLSSFEEYARSLMFGAALFMFQISGMNIKKAKDFMCSVALDFMQSDLPDTKWIKNQ